MNTIGWIMVVVGYAALLAVIVFAPCIIMRRRRRTTIWKSPERPDLLDTYEKDGLPVSHGALWRDYETLAKWALHLEARLGLTGEPR